MTIVEKIIKSVKDRLGNDFPVYYHDEATLNVMTSDMDFPCALFQLLTNGQPVEEAGQVKERVSVAMFFVERSDFDFDAIENETIIHRCKGRAFAWLSSLARSPLVKMERKNGSSRVYDRYDDILTGYGLFLDLSELVGWSDCEEYVCPSDFNDDFNDDFGGDCETESGDFNEDYNNDYN